MQQAERNCQRHPQEVISHICTLTNCQSRFLCQNCIEEMSGHQENWIKNNLKKKLETEINHWKGQQSLEAQMNQKNASIRHFRRLINKLCEEIKDLDQSIQQSKFTYVNLNTINVMESELQKLKSGNLTNVNYQQLKFAEDFDVTSIHNFTIEKKNLEIISQYLGKANQILEQIINWKKDNIQPKVISEDKFYQNCQKMFDEVDDVGDNYQNVQENFQNDPNDIEKIIKSLIATNCESEETLKDIVVSIYLVCKEMKYNLEVNDLFNILTQYVKVEIATNILEDILEHN